MSVSIHTFPPLQTFNSRSWALLAIVILHVGFFWALTAGLVVNIGPTIPKRTEIVPLAPTKPPEEKRIVINQRGEDFKQPIVIPAPTPARFDDEETNAAPTGEVITTRTSSGSTERPHQPVMILPAIPAGGLSEPEYPPQEIRGQHTGTVMLSVQVLPNGRVGEVRIDQSSGYPRLDASAAREARTSRFTPGTSDGVPVAMWRQVPITFRLK